MLMLAITRRMLQWMMGAVPNLIVQVSAVGRIFKGMLAIATVIYWMP
tara:strand:- start:521 stop:661 length:141 start_codon:yes stop_codon:yes gene_type:complete